MEPRAPILSVQWLDSSGTRTETRLNLRPGITLAQAQAGASVYLSVARPLSDAVPVSYSIIFRADDAEPLVPETGSEAHRAALLHFAGVSGGVAHVVIPGVRGELVEQTGRGAGVRLVSDTPALVALQSALLNIPIVTPWAVELDELLSAYVASMMR